ncbi:hypothetical protein ACSBR1_008546 [Camellia fascicularis]
MGPYIIKSIWSGRAIILMDLDGVLTTNQHGQAEEVLSLRGSLGRKPRRATQFGSTTVKTTNFNKRKHLSPVIFYGSPHGVPPKRPSHLLRLLREIRVDLAEQKKLREQVWATFPRQDEAIEYAKEHAHVYVFSYQDHMNGQRRFLVSTYEEFWRRYKNMNPRFRHHYEVIQEGLPCHLYFDLEFNKRDNAEKNGDEMVDLLISVVFDVLFDKYSIQGEHDWIVELDSSTEEKFSRHLIIRLQKTAFKDNSHAGAFVAEVCSRICSARESDGRLEKLLVSKDSGSAGSPCQLFVDTAVYSRNRCFRLPLSSKAGKNSILLPTGRFKCKNMSEEDVFMASLICNMDVDCEKLLICKMDLDCVKVLQFDTEVNSDFQKQSGASQEFTLNSCTSDVSRTYLMGKSPFPALDAFVESIASVRNVSVMYIVDLRRAIYYQKCHDPDCRGYRSPLRPIPIDVIPDATIFVNFVGHNGGSVDENLECQLVENVQEHITFYGDESVTDSVKKDEWWLEAIRVAEKVENPITLDFSGMF